MFKFLLGLNKNLDEIRGRIIGVKPLPSLREAFYQQLNMVESSNLKTQFAPFDNRKKIKGGRPWCDHRDTQEKLAGRFMES